MAGSMADEELDASDELVGVDLLSRPGSLFGSGPGHGKSRRPTLSSSPPIARTHLLTPGAGDGGNDKRAWRSPSPSVACHDDQVVGPGRLTRPFATSPDGRDLPFFSSAKDQTPGVEWPAASRASAGGSASKRASPSTPHPFLKRGSRKEPSALNRRVSTGDSADKNAITTPSSSSRGGYDWAAAEPSSASVKGSRGGGGIGGATRSRPLTTSGKKSTGVAAGAAKHPAPWVGVGIIEQQQPQDEGRREEEGPVLVAAKERGVGGRYLSEEELRREDEEEARSFHALVRSPLSLSEPGDWEHAKDREAHRRELLEFASLERKVMEGEEFPDEYDDDVAGAYGASKGSETRAFHRVQREEGDNEDEEEQRGDEWLGLEDMVRGSINNYSAVRESRDLRPSGGGARAGGDPSSSTYYGEQRYEEEGDYDDRAIGTKYGRLRGEDDEERGGWMASGGEGGGEGAESLPWQSQEELERQEEEQERAVQQRAAAAGHNTPPTSGLVQRLFGGARELSADTTTTTSTTTTTATLKPQQQPGSSVKGSSTTKCLGCSQKRATTLKVEQQLAELEAEVESVRKEKTAAAAARGHYEKLLEQVRKEKQQVVDWLESEKNKLEEQRQAIAKEKKGARQLRAAQLEELNRAAVARQEKAEIEALKATIDKMKVEEEARKRKQALATRRQQSHAKDQQKRIEELESQVEALEQNRLEILERTDLLERQVLRQAMAAKKAAAVGQQQQQPQHVDPLPQTTSKAVEGVPMRRRKPEVTRVQSQPLHKTVPASQLQYEDVADDDDDDDDEEGGVHDDHDGEHYHYQHHRQSIGLGKENEELDVSGTSSAGLNISSASSAAGHKRKRGLVAAGQQRGLLFPHTSILDGSFGTASGEHLHDGKGLLNSHHPASFPSPPPQYDPTKYTPNHRTTAAPTMGARPPPYVPDHEPQPKTTSSRGVLGASVGSLNSSFGGNDSAAKHQQSHGSSFGAQQPAPSAFGKAGKLAKTFADGRQAIWYANGTYKEIFPDGRSVVRFSNGDVKTTVASTGTVIYYYALAKTTQTSHANGLEVFEFPTGQVETHYPDGSKEIIFAGGSTTIVRQQGQQETKKTNDMATMMNNAARTVAYAAAE